MLPEVIYRTGSVRSEASDTSQSKRVSFNNDVDVKHYREVRYPLIPNDTLYGYGIIRESPKLSDKEIALEAERILQQVDQISCSVSSGDTRSLERKSRKNHQNQQQNNWSKTLNSVPSSRTKVEPKNNLYTQNLDPILESGTEMEVFGSKYDSGIEMESQKNVPYRKERPPLGRRNVNLIVRQLTEEASQLKHEDVPRMPRLSLVEPDPRVGLSHNENRPFSYTGGSSPTRTSPLRTVRRSVPDDLPNVKREVMNYRIDEEDEDEEDLEKMKFLFGERTERGRERYRTSYEPDESNDERIVYTNKDVEQINNYKNEANRTSFGTKVLRTSDRTYEQNRIFEYSDDEDYRNGPDSYNCYIKQEPVRDRTTEKIPIVRGRESPDRSYAYEQPKMFANKRETIVRSRENSPDRSFNIYERSQMFANKHNVRRSESPDRNYVHEQPKMFANKQNVRISESPDRSYVREQPKMFANKQNVRMSESPDRSYVREQHKMFANKREKVVRSRENSPDRKYSPEQHLLSANKRTVRRPESPDRNYAREQPKMFANKRETIVRSRENSPDRRYSPERHLLSANKHNLRRPESPDRNYVREQPKMFANKHNLSRENSPDRTFVRERPLMTANKVVRSRENSPNRTYVREQHKMLVNKRNAPVRSRENNSYERDISFANREYRTLDSSRSLKHGQRPLYDEPDEDEPPKPPARTKRRSKANNADRWAPNNRTDTSELDSSPDRTNTLRRRTDTEPQAFAGRTEMDNVRYRTGKHYGHEQVVTRKHQYRFDGQENSKSPSPEPQYRRTVEHVDRRSNSSNSGTAEPVKREKIQRQREKFLSAFLGIGRSNKTSNTEREPPNNRTIDVRTAERETLNRRTTDVRTTERKVPNGRTFDTERYEQPNKIMNGDARLRNGRIKSQSHSNLYHQRDEEVRFFDKQDENHNWNSATLNRVEQRSRRRRDDKARGQPETRRYGSMDVLDDDDAYRATRYHKYEPTGDKRAQQARHAGARHHSSTQQSSATVQPLISNSLHANSSPSEAGSQASQASNMMSGASAESGTSQRSVYLHAATVADIPATSSTAAPASRSGLRAQSRGDISPRSVASDAATMRRARHTSRSFSVLAPWKPRHYREKYEITYTNNQLPLNNENVATLGKPPRPPRKKEDYVSDSEQFTRASAARSSTAAKNSGFAAWFRKKKR